MAGIIENLEKYLGEVHELTEKLDAEPGKEHVFNGHSYRKVSDEIQVFDNGRWMSVKEAIERNFKELINLSKKEPEEDNNSQEDRDPCETCDERDSCEDRQKELDAFFASIGEITDVEINGDDITCTFSDGEVYTAHCHPEDLKRWSLETGISVCIGKYFAGGSNEYNRLVRKGVKAYKDKVKAEAKKIEKLIEEERIRENKKKKHERYLKRRDARKTETRKTEARKTEARKTTEKRKEYFDQVAEFVSDYLKDLGFDFKVEVYEL